MEITMDKLFCLICIFIAFTTISGQALDDIEQAEKDHRKFLSFLCRKSSRAPHCIVFCKLFPKSCIPEDDAEEDVPASPPTPTVETTTWSPPTHPTPTTPSPEECSAVFTCEGKSDGSYPNPLDCSKFFICKYGQLCTITCPSPTLFNPVTSECEDSVACVACPTTEPPTEGTTTPGSVTTTSGPITTTSGPITTTSGPITTTSGPITTTSGPITTTSGPITTTSGPITTTSGPITTTAGTTTEAVTEGTTTPPVTVTPTPTEPTTLPSICTEPFSCAGKSDGNHPNPWNCQTWYFCVSGEIYEGTFPIGCPKGMFYHPIERLCMNVKTCTPLCPNQPPTEGTTTQGSITTTSGPITTTSGPITTTSVPITTTSGPITTTSIPITTTSGPITTTSGPITTTSGPITTTQGTTTEGTTTEAVTEGTTTPPVTVTPTPTTEPTTLPSICLEPFSCVGKSDGNHPNPWNCQTWYFCVSGEIYEGTFPIGCPKGMFYDPIVKACKNVGVMRECSALCPNEPPTQPTTQATTTSGPITTTSGPITTTSEPITTTSGPITTTSGPITTTSVPITTTSGPITTTQGTTTAGTTTEAVTEGTTTPPVTVTPTPTTEPTTLPSICLEPFSCVGKSDGNHPNPWNCQTWYFCVSGEIYEGTFPIGCPKGMFYDPIVKACKNVGVLRECSALCPNEPPTQPTTQATTTSGPITTTTSGPETTTSGPTTTTSGPITTTAGTTTEAVTEGTTTPPVTVTPTPTEPTTLPPICLEPFSCAGKSDGNHPNPWNCETWYFCVSGEIYEGVFPICGPLKFYDPVLKICVTRRGLRTCTPLCPNEPPTETTPMTVASQLPTTVATITATSICDEPFTCSDKPDGIYKDPWNCLSCYVCKSSLITLHSSCPNKKRMSTRTTPGPCQNLCSNPEPTSPTTEVPPQCPPCPVEEFSCAGRADGGYANRWDCSKFYLCGMGEQIPLSCTLGDHWNDALRHCDTPENAKCTPCAPLNTPAPRGEISGIVSSDKRNGSVYSEVEMRALCRNGLNCVDKPSGKYFDPLDCTSAVVCNAGVVTGRMVCPRGMHFNQVSSRCEISKNGRCLNLCGKFNKPNGAASKMIASLKRTPIIIDEKPWN